MIPDDALIIEIKKGSTSSMDVLIRRYYKTVYAYIYRNVFDKSVAYDLTQEVFIKVISRIKHYIEQGTFKSWLLTIASNHCRDYFRSKENKTQLLTDPLDGKADLAGSASVSLTIEKNESSRQIINKMQELPYEQREAVVLRFFEDLKIGEIAAITNTSVSTVKSRLYRGIEKLESLLERSDFYEGYR